MAFKKFKDKIKHNKFFNNMFGFESGIDIADDTQVLYRKNIVIKNIIFISNLVFTLIFAILSFGDSSNFLLSGALGLITFLVNLGLKKTINKNPKDYTTQTIASYIACFYMFLLSIVIYFKLKYGAIDYLKECGYILIYYSLAVCSFYQDKKLLKTIFLWVMVFVSLLHITITYNIIFSDEAKNPILFVQTFFNSDEFRDILLRTVLLAVFMLVLYAIVSMSGYMQEERKKELIKRREVQEDFTSVVTDIFEVTLNRVAKNDKDKEEVYVVSKMAKRLAELLNMTEEEINKIEEFAKIHIERTVNFTTTGANEDEKFANLREQTSIGSLIISRLQLERKCQDIVRFTFEHPADEEFTKRMKSFQNDRQAQIVLICEIYTTMRSVRSYKKAYNHKLTMQYLTEHFKDYFDDEIISRFTRFEDEFEKIYDGNQGEEYEL